MYNVVIEGEGRPILIVHGGMGNLDSWQRVASRLVGRFRVARMTRRQYRLDEPGGVAMEQEVAAVREVAAALDHPVLVGHSSGAVLALEALVADPGLYSAVVLYEPPLVVDAPLGAEANVRARAALDAGKPGTAFAIFLREVAGMRSPMVALATFAMNRQGGKIKPLVERQLDDNDAINALGRRLEAYAKIAVPVLLLQGSRSPRHLHDRLDALAAVLPQASRTVLAGQGHIAERTAPTRLAEAIATFVEAHPAPSRR
ncbi:alpha/beta hydrolase [Actinoplanes sp. Pm04-4]|uniref:Alpha/beta hydrolase n=1 Tax=Paractinoplanes pyxinae TaxID=2997416 RepID=A0ABT4B1U1_9ACTN|nr:alpha/beta hydrolase [Actinoplanes pyxinae]MCY1140446.1 alpha/beta hydrolase [Actinoplanes pyxinae]